MRRTWVLAAAGLPVLAAGLAAARFAWHPRALPLAPSTTDDSTPALSHVERVPHEDEPIERPPAPSLAGLDLSRIGSDDGGPLAPAQQGTARLTLDPELQRLSLGLMAAHHFPEAAVVLMDVATGRLLVYASHVDRQPPRDLCIEATAPSASVFKIVTAAALVEDAHLGPDTKQCYGGGEQRISAIDLVDDPQRDKWCTTLAGAMGRSVNAVFARLAKVELTPPKLEAMARRFGYGQGLPFDVPVQPSALHVPSEPLEFARTAAGFWNTTLSPLEAAEMSAIVARGGEAVRPSIVDKVVSGTGAVVWSSPESPAAHRAVARETAEALSTMMEHTVSEGTSWRAFHDIHGTPYLPGVAVAGKTGTLTDAETQRYYTWFTGFGPLRSQAGIPEVAVAALVVNGPNWQLKANVLAREVLRAYFASRGVPGITRPNIESVARHKKR
jgi:peptidoglycan glycosyltransferase